MVAPYNTPGVYVEEISTLPPSVAEISTAIPAFLGYTEKGPSIAAIRTMLEYEQLFGGPKLAQFTASIDAEGKVTELKRAASDSSAAGAERLMYYAVSHYFKNGGGLCYIVRVGGYTEGPSVTHFENALKALEKEDEPTLLVLTDAVNLAATDYHALCDAALAHCHKVGGRFAILDVQQGTVSSSADATAFRNGIGMNYLAYGAAYYPYLETSLTYAYAESGVSLQPPYASNITANSLRVSYAGTKKAPSVKVEVDTDADAVVAFAATDTELTITVPAETKGSAVLTAWNDWSGTKHGFSLAVAGSGKDVLAAKTVPVGPAFTLDSIKTSNTALYNQIKASLAGQRIVLPPSAAVAGIYASVDRDRGVWKAPANVSATAVVGPVVKLTDEDQDSLNVDSTGGKSINAIRAFTGKGTMVWGARTLAGNDNEWRYVPVRRLFSMIEESTKKATSFAVFEPNDMTTWLKVKGMIESFLYGLWERGALAGPAPAAAYFVNVGLGKTMTTQDVLEGRIIIEIGAAAVRPAEFIILRFSHKLQQA
ncbi:MAG TPA: phage tail sheath C-terminal domain-containing protein [Polyangiaceae bacterium]|nr:phage tail sheath C-terminal domain-containing protein [Polyangiaceae bacterium]